MAIDMMRLIEALIGPAFTTLKAALTAAKREVSKKEYDALVSQMIGELLAETPDLERVRSAMDRAKSKRRPATPTMLRAEAMLDATVQHRARGKFKRAPSARGKRSRAVQVNCGPVDAKRTTVRGAARSATKTVPTDARPAQARRKNVAGKTVQTRRPKKGPNRG